MSSVPQAVTHQQIEMQQQLIDIMQVRFFSFFPVLIRTQVTPMVALVALSKANWNADTAVLLLVDEVRRVHTTSRTYHLLLGHERDHRCLCCVLREAGGKDGRETPITEGLQVRRPEVCFRSLN